VKLYLVTFGKLRTPGLRECVDYYLRNLGAWVEVAEVELKSIAVPDKSPATRVLIQHKESDVFEAKVRSLLSARGKFFILDEIGKAESTQGWAERVRGWESGSIPEVAIGIGSSLGFSSELRKRAHGVFSLGPHTLSHELARAVVSEQLYRAWSVVRGHPYHNEG
jgi:23S rRNA (pseudouridine1915-N3)-methyltransferase